MSASIRTYAESSHPLIVVGDRKTPRDWPQFEMSKNRYIPIEQHGCFEVGRMMPENHYARKNVGYVSAMIDNPDVIFDTDDDNAPNGHWREPPAWECERCISIDAPYNAYKNFTAQSRSRRCDTRAMPDPATHDVELADVLAAAKRIAGLVPATPMLSSLAAARAVEERTGGR